MMLDKSELAKLLAIWLQNAANKASISDVKDFSNNSNDLSPKMIHIDGKSRRGKQSRSIGKVLYKLSVLTVAIIV